MTLVLANEFPNPFNATDGDTRSLTPNPNNANWMADRWRIRKVYRLKPRLSRLSQARHAKVAISGKRPISVAGSADRRHLG